MRRPLTALMIAGWLAACGGSDLDTGASFGIGSGPAVPVGSTGEGSTGAAATGGSTEAVPEDSSAGEPGDGTSTDGLLRDVGAADLGDLQPAGCKGKIDFLFVLSRTGFMESMQARLIAAFPHFIATIEEKFADYDYHIMVVDGDSLWGTIECNEDCSAQGCTVAGYPCEAVAAMSTCDVTMGAGTVFPAGEQASNAACGIAGGRRYLTHEQPDLEATFACVAQIGIDGGSRLADAMLAAISPELNGPGGCNEGFLRDDALLMVTFAANTPDIDSAGKPKLWADAVRAAKHGDPNAVVMFSIQKPDCNPWDMVCDLVKYYFPYWHIIDNNEPDYAPGFDVATDRVVEACSQFIPQ